MNNINYVKCLDYTYEFLRKNISVKYNTEKFGAMSVDNQLLYDKIANSNILHYNEKVSSFSDTFYPEDFGLNKLSIKELFSTDIHLPFNNCFLDFGENVEMVINKDNKRFKILGVNFFDINNRIFSQVYYTSILNTDFSYKDIKSYGSSRMDYESLEFYNKIFDYKEKVLFTSEPKYLKTKKHGNLFRKIVYVVNRKNISKFKNENPTFTHTHRYEVMGHWRKINSNSIGKNRDGDYVIKGFTWVVNHERGPEDMNVIKKTRIYKPLEVYV